MMYRRSHIQLIIKLLLLDLLAYLCLRTLLACCPKPCPKPHAAPCPKAYQLVLSMTTSDASVLNTKTLPHDMPLT